MVSTFRIIHPRNLLGVLGRSGNRLEPLIQTRSDIRHLVVQLRPLCGRTGQDIFVDAEDGLVDARLDALEFDDVDEWLDVGPGTDVGLLWGIFMRQVPEF